MNSRALDSAAMMIFTDFHCWIESSFVVFTLERYFPSLQADKPGRYGQSNDIFGRIHKLIPIQDDAERLTEIASLDPAPAFPRHLCPCRLRARRSQHSFDHVLDHLVDLEKSIKVQSFGRRKPSGHRQTNFVLRQKLPIEMWEPFIYSNTGQLSESTINSVFSKS